MKATLTQALDLNQAGQAYPENVLEAFAALAALAAAVFLVYAVFRVVYLVLRVFTEAALALTLVILMSVVLIGLLNR